MPKIYTEALIGDEEGLVGNTGEIMSFQDFRDGYFARVEVSLELEILKSELDEVLRKLFNLKAMLAKKQNLLDSILSAVANQLAASEGLEDEEIFPSKINSLLKQLVSLLQTNMELGIAEFKIRKEILLLNQIIKSGNTQECELVH